MAAADRSSTFSLNNKSQTCILDEGLCISLKCNLFRMMALSPAAAFWFPYFWFTRWTLDSNRIDDACLPKTFEFWSGKLSFCLHHRATSTMKNLNSWILNYNWRRQLSRKVSAIEHETKETFAWWVCHQKRKLCKPETIQPQRTESTSTLIEWSEDARFFGSSVINYAGKVN